MLTLILIAAGATLANLALELGMISCCITLVTRFGKKHGWGNSKVKDLRAMSAIMLAMLFTHLLQITVWALIFFWIKEFERFQDAYYHSAVNFTTLGYGDIVMDRGWRLLGAIEAAVGMMMFGVSTALLFAILSKVLSNRTHESPS